MPYHNSVGWKRTETSREAAEAISNVTGQFERVVLNALRTHGPMTTREICEATGYPYKGIQPRTSDLFKIGLIKEEGVKKERDNLISKPRNVTIWAIKNNPCQLELPLIS